MPLMPYGVVVRRTHKIGISSLLWVESLFLCSITSGLQFTSQHYVTVANSKRPQVKILGSTDHSCTSISKVMGLHLRKPFGAPRVDDQETRCDSTICSLAVNLSGCLPFASDLKIFVRYSKATSRSNLRCSYLLFLPVNC